MRAGNGFVIPYGTPLNRLHPLSKGLVGCWLLNETGGLTAVDSVKGGINNGTLTNGAVFSMGAKGFCGTFDGSNDHVLINSNSDLRIEGDITISAWVKPITLAASFRQILMKNTGNTGYYGILINSSGKFIFQVPSISPTSTTTLSIGTWYHLCATRKQSGGTGNCVLYINGVADATSGTSSSFLATSTSNLAIGTDLVNAGRAGNHNIKDVKVYNRALSPTEVKQLYMYPFCMFKSKKYFSINTLSGYIYNWGYITG